MCQVRGSMLRSPSGPRWRATVARARGRCRCRPRPRPRGARGPRQDADRGPRRDRKPEEETSGLVADTLVGSGGQPVDLALDPLEGPAVVARGGYGAMAMIAVGDPHARGCRRCTSVRWPSARSPAGASIWPSPSPTTCGHRRRVREESERLTAIVLDRLRHHDLLGEPRVGCTDQAHSGRRRDGRDHRLDSRHERPPRSSRHRDARQAVIAAAALRVSAASSRRSSGRSPAGDRTGA